MDLKIGSMSRCPHSAIDFFHLDNSQNQGPANAVLPCVVCEVFFYSFGVLGVVYVLDNFVQTFDCKDPNYN